MKKIHTLKTAGKKGPYRKKFKLPTEYDLLTLPTLAPITILKTALSITITAIHCEHLDLDDLPMYYENKLSPPRPLVLAQAICDTADELLRYIEDYRNAHLADMNAMKQAADFPF